MTMLYGEESRIYDIEIKYTDRFSVMTTIDCLNIVYLVKKNYIFIAKDESAT